MKRSLIAVVALPFITAGMVQAQQQQVPEAKQTVLGLYVTAEKAYKQWKADPANVKIIDVRTPEEYVFVGHPAMAWNVPLKFLSYEWDAKRKKSVMKLNSDFVAQVKEIV